MSIMQTDIFDAALAERQLDAVCKLAYRTERLKLEGRAFLPLRLLCINDI